MSVDRLMAFLERIELCETEAERWRLVSDAWAVYCNEGAGAFDWDFESRDLFTAMTGNRSFQWMQQ